MKLLQSDKPLVSVRDLHKSFGDLHVLTGIDLDLEPGSATAIIGPNGSGKTTLLKCVLGLAAPSQGRIEVAGRTVGRDVSYRSLIGYMPQTPSFPDNLSGREVVSLIQSMRDNRSRTDRALEELFRLNGEMEKPVRTLSGGTRQKISAVLAFMYEPSLLILDEPTAGLDPVASTALKDHIRQKRDGGAAVVLTSHVLSDLEELCDRVVCLIGGRIRFDGTLGAIRERTGERRLERAVATLLTRETA